jgi:hypothetical protein
LTFTPREIIVIVKIKTAILLISVIGSLQAMGQSPESFESLSIDRPDVSNLPVTVRPGHYQIEMGGEFYKTNYTRESIAPNILLRTGLNKRSELRFGVNSLRQDSLYNAGFDKVLVGTLSVKYRFVEEKGARPSIAIQPEFALPFGSGREFSRNHANFTLSDYAVFLLFNNTVHEKIFINYNAGLFWNKNERLDYLVSASTSFLHTHRLGYFLEIYTLIEDKNELPVSFDGGVTYLFTPRFQVDIYGGNREDGEDRYWFYGLGVGFRIDPQDLKPKTFKDIGVHH